MPPPVTACFIYATAGLLLILIFDYYRFVVEFERVRYSLPLGTASICRSSCLARAGAERDTHAALRFVCVCRLVIRFPYLISPLVVCFSSIRSSSLFIPLCHFLFLIRSSSLWPMLFEMAICILHQVPFMQIRKIGIVMFLRAYLFLRVVRDYSHIYIWRQDVRHAGANQVWTWF